MVQLISFSIPKKSSSGRPVSLHVGKGMYCSCPFESVMCSPVSLGRVLAGVLWMGAKGEGKVHGAVETGDGDWLAGVVAASFLERLQWLLTACCAGEGCVQGTQRQERQPGGSRRHCAKT